MPHKAGEIWANSPRFQAMCYSVLASGAKLRFHACGMSMQPNILDGDLVVVETANVARVKVGEVVLTDSAAGFRLHRLVSINLNTSSVITKGDAGIETDLSTREVLGKVIAIERAGTSSATSGHTNIAKQRLRTAFRRIKQAVAVRFRNLGLARFLLLSFFPVLALASSQSALAQSADLAMTQTVAPTTVAAGANLTYTEVITNNGPNAATTTTLFQPVPANTTFVSIANTGGWTCTTPAVGGTGNINCTVPSFANGASVTFTVIVNVVAGATTGTQITNSANVTSTTVDPNGANNANLTTVNVEKTGNADLAVSTTASPSPVFVSSTLTYTLAIQNLGLANITNSATVTDTFPATTTFVSAITSQGSCTNTATAATCALGPLASGASAIVTVTVTTPPTAQSISNTAAASASVIDPTDPNGANNTSTTATLVQASSCSTPGKTGAGGNLTGIINTYYPPRTIGTGIAVGATSVRVGTRTPTGSTQIAIGDRLLIVEMQNANLANPGDATKSNSSQYGDGVNGDPGSGFASLQSSGKYEYVTATSTVSAGGFGNPAIGTLNWAGTGPGGGTVNSYNSSAYTAGSNGQQTWQIIRVPQYTTAALTSGLTARAWDGSTGGVLTFDVASLLTLNGATVSVDGLGFRGGAGRALAGHAGAMTDYVTLASDAGNGSKGEGIAGTPRFTATNDLTGVTDNTDEGYPQGSYARGAPANAGGGGTDSNPPANDENSGGGGGANGGGGGQGGYAWSTSANSGGFGGAVFPASVNLVVMGGGGGAGTTNNGTSDPNTNTTGINSSGAAGGGIVLVTAGAVTGTGTITANGQPALNVQNDGGGGGGAGGSIVFLTNTGLLAGLTVSANGGGGGDTWLTQAPAAYPGSRHGPGGGGGGGVIILSSSGATASVAGGLNGTTTTALDAFGATPGSIGVLITNAITGSVPGPQGGAFCSSADVAVTNSGTPNVVTPGSNITYTQTVTNNGPSTAVGLVFSEAIPANTTFQSITTPAGWACTAPAVGATGSISCTNPSIASGAAASSFILVVKVNPGTTDQTQITDVDSETAGPTDPVLSNNSASVTTVVSLVTGADLVVTNTAAPNPVAAGSNIAYSQIVVNNGPAAAANVVFSELLPANTTFVSMATPAGWTCPTAAAIASAGAITCTISTLASGGTATFAPVLKVTAGTGAGTAIADTASVSATTLDPNPTSNSATATVIVATPTQADLAVTASASPSPVQPGANITFVQTVKNNGPAAAATDTFAETIPAGATLVSFLVPTGWACPTVPAVGSSGAISCTAVTLASGASSSFPLVLNVTATTPAGTVISLTPTVGTGSTDPISGNNSATASSVVAGAGLADISIVKSAKPEPVDQNTNLVYTLTVSNNGPGAAQNVTLNDPLPTQVTFASVSTTQGSCSQSGGTVSCSLGTLNVGTVANITINVNAATFSSASAGLAVNTAKVATTSGDPLLTNNTSTATSTIQAPTAVQLVSFKAISQLDGTVLLEWKTREEIRNLGFNVYRETASGRQRLNPSLVAGSALILKHSKPQHGAKTYQWMDLHPLPGVSYTLEDVDLSGARISHGPVQPEQSATFATRSNVATPLLTHMNELASSGSKSVPSSPRRIFREFIPPVSISEPAIAPVNLDGQASVKISVNHAGWYRVSRAQLLEAGFDASANAHTLQLYAEGIEQALLINGSQVGPLGANDSIEFYGTGTDTPYSDTRVYWLVWGRENGKRIPLERPYTGRTPIESFPDAAVREDHITYFAALLNSEDQDNFFGALVTNEPVDQVLDVVNAKSSNIPVSLDVTLQGVTEGQAHDVSVTLNGNFVGNLSFADQANFHGNFPISASMIQEGANTVTLRALEGENDVSLVQSIALQYSHSFVANGDSLYTQAAPGSQIHATGFSDSRVRIFDFTNPHAVMQLQGSARLENGSYSVDFGVPGSAYSNQSRSLLLIADNEIESPAFLSFHAVGGLSTHQIPASIVMITHSDFVPALAPLVIHRQQQGYSVNVVTTDQIFDAYNFGERSPYAVRDFLSKLSARSQTKPQFVLLVGDASVDPRNYLGFGTFDFVPTRLIDTSELKTASDDWFSDFNQTGYGTIAIGRLPVRTADEASIVISKILDYESGRNSGSWNSQALVVSDQNVGANFSATADKIALTLKPSFDVHQLSSGDADPQMIKQQLLASINQGAAVVNFTGHGAVEQWSFSDLFDNNDAAALQNGSRLPVFFIMNCLNGFFQDVYTQSLAESLMLNPNGGAVAVWASSGFTDAPPQAGQDLSLAALLSANPKMPLGQLVLRSKSQTIDRDVRRTWILFGDPAMRIQAVAPKTVPAVRSIATPSTSIQSAPGLTKGKTNRP